MSEHHCENCGLPLFVREEDNYDSAKAFCGGCGWQKGMKLVQKPDGFWKWVMPE